MASPGNRHRASCRPIGTLSFPIILRSVCVCLLVTTASCAKTAEPIDVLFGIRTRVGPLSHVLDGGLEDPPGNGKFGASLGPSVNYGQYLQPRSIGGSSDAAFRCRYCSNSIVVLQATDRGCAVTCPCAARPRPLGRCPR